MMKATSDINFGYPQSNSSSARVGCAPGVYGRDLQLIAIVCCFRVSTGDVIACGKVSVVPRGCQAIAGAKALKVALENAHESEQR